VRKAPKPKTEMPGDYHFTKGVRRKYASRYARGTRLVLLAPDLAKIFPSSESVNRALRELVTVARKSVK